MPVKKKWGATGSYRTKGGTVAKIQKHTYPDDWRDLCKRKIAACRGVCQRCPSSERLEVHHIIPLSRGGSNLDLNLIVLCYKCHNKRHKHMVHRQPR